jgi:predicted patatin/cPLA2 family phospholipase
MTRRALVIGPGAVRAAYDAGVLTVLAEELGRDHFDTVYASSAGAFNATYFVTGQTDVMEKFWRENGGDRKFFSLRNVFRGRPFLNLEYLRKTLSEGPYKMDFTRLDQTDTKLTLLLSHSPSGELEYRTVNTSNCLDYLHAGAAMPLLHKPITVNGVAYSDVSATVNPLPIERALEDGHDEVIAVYNKHSKYSMPLTPKIIFQLLYWRLPQSYIDMFKSYAQSRIYVEDLIDSDPRIKVIRPEGRLPVRGHFDRNKKRINATVDLGIEDGNVFLQQVGK